VHEASIVREILEMAARRSEGARVMEVRVTVGLLSGVSPDALAFYFDVLRGDTLGAQAQLEVALAPLRARCAACGRGAMLDELLWSCPACAGALMFDDGMELSLTGLVVEHE
jgi:hydrogenase nickel incorporation protein HypA/HybF